MGPRMQEEEEVVVVVVASSVGVVVGFPWQRTVSLLLPWRVLEASCVVGKDEEEEEVVRGVGSETARQEV